MNWAWGNLLDQVWRSPAFPTWLTLAAAGFFGVIVIVTLLRAEKSVANGALTVITLLAVGVAVAATIPGFGGAGSSADSGSQASIIATPAPLSCLDDLAGEPVLTACEKALFGSAEQAAAAVSYASSQITRLTTFGDLVAANKNMTAEQQALRHAVEHDRYGLIAYVLTVRDNCTPSDCAAFRLITDRKQIASNMEERVYETTISRYAPTWIAPPAQPPMPVAALVPGVPTGRPTNAEFPSSASTPPVSIMTPEPGTSTGSVPRATAPSANAAPPSSRPAPATSPAPAANAPSPRPTSSASPTLAAAKKQPAPKPSRTPAPAAAPVSIAPAAPAPAASNE
jgi:hypothetical protein